MNEQADLFDARPDLPSGLRHQPDLIAPDEEAELVRHLERLTFRPFEFQGFTGRRRVASFGWRYVFDGSGLQEAEPLPDFALPLRERAAGFAGLPAPLLEQLLITEYQPGATIGWHRDRPVFGEVVGLSLLTAAPLRFRRRSGERWERRTLLVEPRSAYHLSGAARTEWEHSIAALDGLRYSLTFRTLAGARPG